ncbi:MAG TPA: GAF domain-containing protein [Candidatus Acidoferrum sp.]|nr:GAF domain-containing protein [Candidatus Acidoferrum sp.]
MRKPGALAMLSDAKMPQSRLTLLPDERLAPALPALQECLSSAGDSIAAENLASMLDETMKRVIHLAFQQAGADEGTVWLLDESKEALIPAYNTGPNADQFVGHFRQPLSAGLVSMVFGNEKPFTENEVPKNAKQDKRLDTILKTQTLAMIIVPLYFLDACRGVISCVKLGVPGAKARDAQGFSDSAQGLMVHGATLLGRLIDLRVLRISLGLR